MKREFRNSQLEAARKYHKLGSIIVGFNLGNVGFLASVRDEQDFLKKLKDFFRGKYSVVERMMISAQVHRDGKEIYNAEALNEVVIKNPLSMVELEAKVAGHPVKHIRGTGLLISTATGSTAYNLSAHGPIVMPNIKCFVITQLLDHSIPSPSVVIKFDHIISVKVISFRKREFLSISKTGKEFDVLMMTDGGSAFPLQKMIKLLFKVRIIWLNLPNLRKIIFSKASRINSGLNNEITRP